MERGKRLPVEKTWPSAWILREIHQRSGTQVFPCAGVRPRTAVPRGEFLGVANDSGPATVGRRERSLRARG